MAIRPAVPHVHSKEIVMTNLDPIPLETLVYYQGSRGEGLFRVFSHETPIPPRGATQEEMKAAYPDDIGYCLWPEGMLRKLDNRWHMVWNIRRKSLKVIEVME